MCTASIIAAITIALLTLKLNVESNYDIAKSVFVIVFGFMLRRSACNAFHGEREKKKRKKWCLLFQPKSKLPRLTVHFPNNAIPQLHTVSSKCTSYVEMNQCTYLQSSMLDTEH
jgi:hypothetical protein